MISGGAIPRHRLIALSTELLDGLGESEHIGTLAVGKQADIVIVTGDPSVNIADVRNVNLVFKDGVAFDSAKLIDSVSNQVGTGK